MRVSEPRPCLTLPDPKTGLIRTRATWHNAKDESVASAIRLAEVAMNYQIQFLDQSRAVIVREHLIEAADHKGAIALAKDLPWPKGAKTLRLLEPGGRTVHSADKS